MDKLWTGRTAGTTDRTADDFNSSLPFDRRLYPQDIGGSIAHAKMLAKQGILAQAESARIVRGLKAILRDLDEGALPFPTDCEDIHSFVEQELTGRIGESGKKLHTARSRNDQVVLDLRLYLRSETDALTEEIHGLIRALLEQAEAHKDAVMPGYTHLQRAQPVLFSHYLLAYCMMFLRDVDRLKNCRKRINVSPIGCCALAGTTYPVDRRYEARLLGMEDIARNSIDGVSDRDFAAEFVFCLSLTAVHMSRLAEELILWSSWEFRFIELDDAFTTGSSIMPQKKNPDMAELARGKTGRVLGDLTALLTMLKGLPLAYNKDMQEDKEAVFDAADTVRMCLSVFTPMVRTLRPVPENMLSACREGFLNATDLADYLVGKGVPFRDAYKVSGKAVALCAKRKIFLEDLPLGELRSLSDRFEEDVYEQISIDACVRRRISEGGTGPESVLSQIGWVKEQLSKG